MTAGYAALWVVLVVHGWGPLLAGDAGDWLHYLGSSAARMTARDLDFAEALEARSGAWGVAGRALLGARDETIDAAVEVQRDVVDTAGNPSTRERARLRLALLLFESARVEEALAEAPESDLALLLTAGRAPDRGNGRSAEPLAAEALDDGLAAIAASGLEDWYRDRLSIRLARRAGREDLAEDIVAQMLARGRRLEQRGTALWLANVGLALAGLVVLATRLRSLLPRAEGAGTRPPWSLADGLGVLVRGDFWSRLYLVAVVQLESPIGGEALASSASTVALDWLYGWGTLFSSLPLAWLVWRHLLAPAARDRRGRRDPLGLDARSVGVARIATVAVAAIALDFSGTYAISWGAWVLGVEGHWAEGFDETLVWGDALQAALTASDYTIWAPVTEELAFRGLLFFSLRSRLGAGPAAALSAGVFAALHFYSVAGFAMTFWSGIVWSFAFESARSLWPGIAAHAVYNASYVAGLVLLYR